MTNGVRIQNYPLFEKGVFEKYPSLFNTYLHNMPGHLKEKYQKARKTLSKYEEILTWSLVSGPGFCGVTHPGAGKTFNGIMVGSNSPIYNSDCVYANPSKHIFAISDSPGVTTFSRDLFMKLDLCLQSRPVDDLETIINDLSSKTTANDHATFTAIGFYAPRSEKGFDSALAFVAGDTFLFHGNVFQGTMTRVEGNPNFLGTSNIYFEPIHINIEKGDFFVIASDGITAVRSDHQDTRLENALLGHLNSDPEKFVSHVIQTCNRIMEEKMPFGLRTSLGGSDDISVFLVYPEKLSDTICQNSVILGGYTGL
jgi:hypothetical protein